MKTREQLYKGEGAALLRILTTYHTLHYEVLSELWVHNDCKEGLNMVSV